MQKPSGGAKDTHPPVVVSSSPNQGATNVNTSRIEIHFDEFFKLKNFQNELLISPPLDETPLISQKGKSLFIELKEELNPNSTYTFNFGKGIADYHEGNILKDYSLVFSTGNELDSLSLSGQLYSCPLATLPEEVIIGIYQKDSLLRDSTIYQQKPDYFTLAKEKGAFQIKHIRTGTFELIAFEDLNANYQYDGATEQIAFYDSLITISDSSEFELWLFQEKTELKLLESKANENGRIHWAYNQTIDSVNFNSDSEIKFLHTIKQDSLLVWPLIYPTDSFYICSEVATRLDSVLVKTDSLHKQKLNLSSNNQFLKESASFKIQSDAPILAIDTSRIHLISDSIPIDYSVRYTDFELIFDFIHNENQTFHLILSEGAVLSTYENYNDSINLSAYSKDESALAALKINLLLKTDDYFIEILKEEKVIDRIETGEELIFKELLPSKYQLRLTLDSNNDGKWTAGDYFENSQAEKVIYYTEELKLRANWELEIDFNPID
jgi:hypothetical protein